MSSSKKSMLLMLTTVLLWSTSGLIIRILPWNALVIAGLRSGIALLTMLAYMKITKITFCRSKIVIVTSLLVAIKFISFVSANKLTASGNAVALQSTSTIFVLIYSLLILKQKARLKDVLVIIATTMGIALFFVGKYTAQGIMGNLLALVCGISTAAFYVISCKIADPTVTLSMTAMGHGWVFLIGIPFLFLYPPEFSAQSLGAILFLGAIQQGAAFIVYSKVTKSVSAVTFAIISSLEPIFNPIWVFIALGDAPTPFAIAGAVIVIGSILAWSLSNAAQAKREGLAG